MHLKNSALSTCRANTIVNLNERVLRAWALSLTATIRWLGTKPAMMLPSDAQIAFDKQALASDVDRSVIAGKHRESQRAEKRLGNYPSLCVWWTE